MRTPPTQLGLGLSRRASAPRQLQGFCLRRNAAGLPPAVRAPRGAPATRDQVGTRERGIEMQASTGVLATGALAALLGLAPIVGDAAPRGSEFDNQMGPASGGMEGVAVARPQDAIGMLFANPATLTQIKARTEFLLGAAYVAPDLDASGPPTDLFGGPPDQAPLTGAFSGDSRLRAVLAPNAAALHRFSDNLVGGFGFTGLSGLGGDFRNVDGLPNLVSDLKIFGANFGAAYQVTEAWSIGAVGTLGIGSLQIGLTNNSGAVNNFGFGGAVGTTYDLGPVVLGVTYRAPLSITYKQLIERAPDDFADLELEQPQQAQFGIATTPAILPNSLIALDFTWKDWSGAETYSSLWEDQFIGAIGVQHRFGEGIGAVTLRGGYSYSTRLPEDDDEIGSGFGDLETVATPDQSGSLPVTPTFVQLAHATITNGYWRQGISVGLGVKLLDSVRVDLHGNYGFDGKERIGPFQSEASILQIGVGLTWTIPNSHPPLREAARSERPIISPDGPDRPRDADDNAGLAEAKAKAA